MSKTATMIWTEDKLARDQATLAKVIDNPRTAQWYVEHLEARIKFDKAMMATAWRRLSYYDKIQTLVRRGVLSREMCPEPHYWRWNILKRDELPQEFSHCLNWGEVRWYGEE